MTSRTSSDLSCFSGQEGPRSWWKIKVIKIEVDWAGP